MEAKIPLSQGRSLNLPRLCETPWRAALGCRAASLRWVLAGYGVSKEAQETPIEFFALLQSALILCVPPFSWKNITIADESWDTRTENRESLKQEVARLCRQSCIPFC